MLGRLFNRDSSNRDWSKNPDVKQLRQIQPIIKKMREQVGRQNTGNKNFSFVNAPMLAYETVYGKKKFIMGRSGGPQKKWNGIYVDKHLKDKWLNDLNKIKKIEVRSTEEGKSKERVSAVIFRFKKAIDDKHTIKVVQQLNKIPGIYAKSDIGMYNRPRICVAGKYTYGQSKWQEWWDAVPETIDTIVNNATKTKGMINKQAYIQAFEKELGKLEFNSLIRKLRMK